MATILTLSQYCKKANVSKQALKNKTHSQYIQKLEQYVFMDGNPVPVGKRLFVVLP